MSFYEQIYNLETYKALMTCRINKIKETDHIVHDHMIYECRRCGSIYIMLLEQGLADRFSDSFISEEDYKTVLSAFQCICCGGDVIHILPAKKLPIRTDPRSYNEITNEYNKNTFRNFFWNEPNFSYGIPILFEPDFVASELLNYCYGIEELNESCKLSSVPSNNLTFKKESLYPYGYMNREERRHGPLGNKGYKRPKKNQKLYEY